MSRNLASRKIERNVNKLGKRMKGKKNVKKSRKRNVKKSRWK